MTGFVVSTAAVFLTAWIVYTATYRAAYMQGQMDRDKEWQVDLRKVVPAGTHPECTTDPNCPLQQLRTPKACGCHPHDPCMCMPPETFAAFGHRNNCNCEICRDERNG